MNEDFIKKKITIQFAHYKRPENNFSLSRISLQFGIPLLIVLPWAEEDEEDRFSKKRLHMS